MGLTASTMVCAALLAVASTPAKAGSDHDAHEFVEAHNAVRATVQKPAGYPGAWTPLPPVTWSDELARSAQGWADHLHDAMKCGLTHDPDTRYGENLGAGKKLDAEDAVRMWAGEQGKFRWMPHYEFERASGHYSQLVWRKTTQIGCGRATCGRNAVIVCRYNPPGNHIGKPPY